MSNLPESHPEPLRCPFCKSENVRATLAALTAWVSCGDCNAEGPTASSRQQAVELWNNASRASSEGGAGPLTFAQLRAANVARLPLFKNRWGETAHSQPDGSDWSLGEWCNAVLGELGEAANLIKKVHRGDLTLDEARSDLAREYRKGVLGAQRRDARQRGFR